MRCVVTGVAGFIGSHLAEHLLADGHEVCGIDAFIDYYPRFMKERNLEGPRSWQHFTFVEGDILDINLNPLLEGADWIFHSAAQAGVRASWGWEFGRYVNCNVLATQRLLEVAQRVKSLRRFVYASSSSVYGDTPVLPVTETVTPQPISPYGVTKLAAEHLCTLYHRNFGVPTVSLRYFTVYGPRQRPDMAFHRFCKAVVEHQPLHIYGDGGQTRDFTYIEDAVEANMRAATAEAAVGEALNIAGGSRVTLHEVIDLLRAVSDTRVTVDFSDRQHGDVRDTFADTTRAERVLGYRPRVALREGLAREFQHIIALYQPVTGIAARTRG
jgi:nucleoside-diphosphate-sugar epimerase